MSFRVFGSDSTSEFVQSCLLRSWRGGKLVVRVNFGTNVEGCSHVLCLLIRGSPFGFDPIVVRASVVKRGLLPREAREQNTSAFDNKDGTLPLSLKHSSLERNSYCNRRDGTDGRRIATLLCRIETTAHGCALSCPVLP